MKRESIQIRMENGQTKETLGYKFGKFVTVHRSLFSKPDWDISIDGTSLMLFFDFKYACEMAQALFDVEDQIHGFYRNGIVHLDKASLEIILNIRAHYIRNLPYNL